MAPESDCPVIVLASGQTLRVRKVVLYDEELVEEIAVLRAHATKSLAAAGAPSGLGVLGAPSWGLVGGAVAVSVVGGFLSSVLGNQAAAMLQTAQAKSEQLAKSATSFDVTHLTNIHVPHPQAWVFVARAVERQIDVSQLATTARDELFKKYGKTKHDIINGKIKVDWQQRFIHNGDEFVNVETDIGAMSIRWSHVVAYFPPQHPHV